MLIQYPYALNEQGDLLYIKDITKENRAEHTYTCPNCGNPMLPRLGEHNAHCFAHQGGNACGKESYIHKTAKSILAKRFNESDSFTVTFNVEHICEKCDSCEYYEDYCCSFTESVSYDFKQYYDLPALIEKVVYIDNKKFIPDVLLQSSNNRHCHTFLEVYNKHKSTAEKIENNRCVEFKIKDFEDLRALEIEPIVESKTTRFFNFKKIKESANGIEEHIYKNSGGRNWVEEYDLPFCKRSLEFQREVSHLHKFILYKSGKTYDSGILENEINEHKPSAIAEVIYNDMTPEFFPILALAQKDKRFRVCKLCRHCMCNIDEITWCELVKNGTSRKGTFNSFKGATCKFFEWGEFLLENMAKQKEHIEGQDYFVWISENYTNL